MTTPESITVWACPECGYWRKDKTTGVHQVDNPANARGAMVVHQLVQVVYFRPVDGKFPGGEVTR